MMHEIALISDTHIGARGDQLAFLDHQSRFFREVFFPTLRSRNIRNVIHLGDLVDRRKFININTLKRLKEDFLNPLENSFKTFIISGNHDIYHKNSSTVNALSQILSGYHEISHYISPTHIEIYGHKLLLVPWITPENREFTEKFIQKSKADFCFGHLELSGFSMNPGTVAEHGDDSTPYSKFEKVFSGHYHTKSSRDNIHYLGAPFQFTWGDFSDPRGFHILSLDSGNLEFVENPYTLFNRLKYDGEPLPQNLNLGNTYVKVVVTSKKSHADFENFLKDIEKNSPIDLKIIEFQKLDVEESTFSGTESTEAIIQKYIENIEVNADKFKLEQLMINLYKEAVLLET